VVVPPFHGELAGQGHGKRPAVENSGQWVVHGLVGERLARLHQPLLQLDQAPAHIDTGAEFVGVEGFGHVVVGSGLQSATMSAFSSRDVRMMM